jgi:hypothetical protein
MLAAGAAGLGYAWWTRAVPDADAALAAGDLDRAHAGYVAAAARLDRIPGVRRLFAAEYARVVGNDLLTLYRLQRYDDIIDRAARAPEASSPHFWSGCAFFQKATADDTPQNLGEWFTRAQEEFRAAATAAPDDWDVKYDLELTTRLMALLQKVPPKTPPLELMQLLRQGTPGTIQAPKRVG